MVKGSFFIVVRLWFEAMPALPGPVAAQLLAALGSAAILFGSILAMRQQRLKLLIAYSTLAQIGYLFLMFPLAFDPRGQALHDGGAAAGGMLQAVSHATAKAAMFMAAGVIYQALGHDRMTAFARIGWSLPITLFAFALAGVALIGVPPSGAYLAKSLLLQAASETAQWWWAVTLQLGGILTSGHVLLVLAHAALPTAARLKPRAPVPRIQEAAALALAVMSLLLGVFPWDAYLAMPASAAVNPLTIRALLSALWPIPVGGVIAMLMGPWRLQISKLPRVLMALAGRMRAFTVASAAGAEEVDGALRQWPAASLALSALVLVFGMAMLWGH